MSGRQNAEAADQKFMDVMNATIQKDKQQMETLGRVVFTMLEGEEIITLDSIIKFCLQHHEKIGQRIKPEVDPYWFSLPPVIEELKKLNKTV